MAYTTGRKPWPSEAPKGLTDESRAVGQKLFSLGLVVFVVFAVLTLQLARLQLVRGGEFEARAETNRLRQVAITPSRGLIYDRNGLPLVENRATFAAAIVPADIPKDRQTEITIALQELVAGPAGGISRPIDERRQSHAPVSPPGLPG